MAFILDLLPVVSDRRKFVDLKQLIKCSLKYALYSVNLDVKMVLQLVTAVLTYLFWCVSALFVSFFCHKSRLIGCMYDW